jgi:hypothetical protein
MLPSNASRRPHPRRSRGQRITAAVKHGAHEAVTNVVTADSIAEGVPVVAGDAIEWVPRWWQARADEPLDVVRVARRKNVVSRPSSAAASRTGRSSR